MKRNATAAMIAVLITTIFVVTGLSRPASASAVEDVYDRVRGERS